MAQTDLLMTFCPQLRQSAGSALCLRLTLPAVGIEPDERGLLRSTR